MSARTRNRLPAKIRIAPLRSTLAVAANASHSGAPGAIGEAISAIHDLAGAVTQFQSNVDQRITTLERDLDAVSGAQAAARMNGNVVAFPGGRIDHGKAMKEFAQFLRSTASLNVHAAMTTDSNPDGGFLVDGVVEQSIGSTLADLSPMRRLASNTTISTGNSYKIHLWADDADCRWTSERAGPVQTDMSKLVQIDIPVHDLEAMPAVTQNALDDARVDLGAEVAGRLQRTFSLKEGNAFINGTGNGQPAGILGGVYGFTDEQDGERAFRDMQYVASGSTAGFLPLDADELDAAPIDPLITMVGELAVAYHANASWLMNSRTAAVCRRLKMLDGRPAWEDSAQAGVPARLLGFPVTLDPNAPNIAENAYPIIFGDFARGYRILDRLGITVLPDRYTQKPYTLFWTRKRLGGSVVDTCALKVLKIAAS